MPTVGIFSAAGQSHSAFFWYRLHPRRAPPSPPAPVSAPCLRAPRDLRRCSLGGSHPEAAVPQPLCTLLPQAAVPAPRHCRTACACHGRWHVTQCSVAQLCPGVRPAGSTHRSHQPGCSGRVPLVPGQHPSFLSDLPLSAGWSPQPTHGFGGTQAQVLTSAPRTPMENAANRQI